MITEIRLFTSVSRIIDSDNNSNSGTKKFVAAKIVRQMADGVNYTTQNYCMMLFFLSLLLPLAIALSSLAFLISSSLKCFSIIFAFCLSLFFASSSLRVWTFDRQKTSGNKVNEHNETYGDNKYKINVLFSHSLLLFLSMCVCVWEHVSLHLYRHFGWYGLLVINLTVG